MSELAEMTGGGIPEVIPGFHLSRANFAALGDAEAEFERIHMMKAAEAAASLPGAVGDRIVAAASADVANHLFSYGSPAFDRRAQSDSHLPFMLWLCLRAKHPTLTRQQVADLLEKNRDRKAEIWRAVMECMGYRLRTPTASASGSSGTVEDEQQNPPAAASTGDRSSAPSAPAASPTTRSAA